MQPQKNLQRPESGRPVTTKSKVNRAAISEPRTGNLQPVGLVVGADSFVCEAVAHALEAPGSLFVAVSSTEADELIRKGGRHLIVLLGLGPETYPLIEMTEFSDNLHFVIATSDELSKPLVVPTLDITRVNTFEDLLTYVDQVLARKTSILTERSKEILQRLAKGDSPSEAADFLGITVGTLSNQLSVIYRQMNVTNATQAVLAALRKGLIEL
jgi:DNA-binding CsgD family transcriptional regulator